MVLGLPISGFTHFHVLISLIGLASGIFVLFRMLQNHHPRGWVNTFLISTIATSVTGFMFPSKFGPADVIGVLSLIVLAVAAAALYRYRLQGRWRWVYIVGALIALYLNFFVAVVQTFQKVRFFHSLAPTQAEPPFAIVQGVVLLAFVALIVIAIRRFRPTGLMAVS
jgi:hypothetical protein